MNKYEKPTGSYISFMSNKVKTYGGINFAQGIPGFQPPKELLDELNAITHDPIHQYAPGIGNIDLLELLVEKYKSDYSFTKDDILILQGATEALSLLFIYFKKTIKEKFSALAFDPVYESYKYLPPIFDTDFIAFSLNEDGTVDFKKLKEDCKTNNVKIIFLGTPGNPYGKIWSKNEINQLIEICNEQSINLVMDAVYQELYFTERPYVPLDQFNENIFYINSFSKILSITGWRIGYLIAHEKHMQAIKSIHDYTGLCAPSLQQQAIVNYIRKNNYGKDYISDLRLKLKNGFDKLSSALLDLGFTIPETKGGYFVWAKLPKQYTDGFKFTIDLYDQQKVAVIPGEHFSDKCTDYIRLNIAREKEEVDEGIVRIIKFFKQN